MKPPDEAKRDLVGQWVAKAEEDFLAADTLIASGAECADVIAFLSQQAAEKLLKAYLTWLQIDFPRTHDIGRLLDILAGADADTAERLANADALSDYGVEIRYPGELPVLTIDAAKQAFALALQVRAAILALLPGEPGDARR
jgi:HEPN domain-containing protein